MVYADNNSSLTVVKGPFTRHGKGAVAIHGKVAVKMG